MCAKRLDYDRLAPTYDRRFQTSNKSGTAVALLALVRELGAKSILEVGCGTGRWLADLRPATGRLYGLDLSAGMLNRARGRDSQLHLARGRAGRLPFPESSFDLVYCVNAIHHFCQQRAFVVEARRLLRPGGALAVVGMDPHGRCDSWYVYRYFAGTYQTDLERFPSWGTVLDWMIAARFECAAWRGVERIHDDKIGRAVLEDPFLAKDSTSQLALLSDREYAEGLCRIRAELEAAEASRKTPVFQSDILIGMLVGRIL